MIKLLPESIANQIAAGEVVQRPASVVKELLENAIDAGAGKIQLIIRDAGTTFIQVKDDGKGMSETDARMCWERHATSKINRAEDLFNLSTFGFRGEAMASIASVSQVELKTRREEDALGTEIKMDAGNVVYQEPVNTPKGTIITVKNLFYNIPARKNFLKSPSIESRHIFDEFNRVALPNPQIEFSLFNNQSEELRLPVTSQENRIYDLLGRKHKGELIALQEETEIVTLNGYIGSPHYAKRTRGDQFFFINGRYIREPYFHHALQTAFNGLIPDDHFPFYVIFLQIHPTKIDVNVHPTKTEVKFEDSKPIYSILLSVVRKALGRYTLSPQIEDNRIFQFEQRETPESTLIQEFNKKSHNPHYNPFAGDIHPQKKQDWGKLMEPFRRPEPFISDVQKEEPAAEELAPPPALFESEEKAGFEGLFQLRGGYIVCSKAHQLYIVNQQAAHERVLYDQFLRQFVHHKTTVQTLLFPRVVEFNAADYSMIMDLLDEIKQLGFDIHPFGKNTFIINGVPTINEKADPQVILDGVLGNYRLNEQNLKLDKKENLARSMARNAALRASDQLSLPEMEELLQKLFESNEPNFLPNGKPVFIKITQEGLSDMLKKP